MGIQAYLLAFQNLKFSADMALLVIAMVVPLAVSLIHVLRVYTKTRFELPRSASSKDGLAGLA